MSSFEFGTTPPVIPAPPDWEELFSQAPQEPEQEQQCTADCCDPTPEEGLL